MANVIWTIKTNIYQCIASAQTESTIYAVVICVELSFIRYTSHHLDVIFTNIYIPTGTILREWWNDNGSLNLLNVYRASYAPNKL